MTPDLEGLVPYLIQRLGANALDLLVAAWHVDQLNGRIAELEAKTEGEEDDDE